MTALIGGSVLLIAASAIALALGWGTADEQLIWTSIATSAGAGILLALAAYRSRTARTASGPLAAATDRDGSSENATSVRTVGRTSSRSGTATAEAPHEAEPEIPPMTAPSAQRARREPQRQDRVKTTSTRRSSGTGETSARPTAGASGADAAAAAPATSASDRARDLSRDIAGATGTGGRARSGAKSGSGTAARSAPASGDATVRSSTRKTTAAKPSTTRGKGASGSTRSEAQVVVLPERGRFHRPECRFAQGADAETISKSAARRRGYEPCGVCKP